MPAVRWPALIVLAAALACLGLPLVFGVSPALARASALVVFCIGFWATASLPEHLTAVAFFLAAVLLGVAPPPIVFSGFHSTAFWLVFGGLVIGAAVDRTGLGQRMARRVVAAVATSYLRVVAGIVTMAIGLAFLMPSTMGRVVLLMPIVLALADRLGFAPGRPGRTGMVLALAIPTYLGSTAILPANVPNNLLAGAAESFHGVTITYFSYLALHFPVLGLLKGVVMVFLIVRLFPDRIAAPDTALATASTMARDEIRLAVILAGALALWTTDALHHVSPAWVSLGAGLLCLLPAIGVVDAQAFRERVSLGALLYVAGFIGVAAVIQDSGLGQVIAAALIDLAHMEPGQVAYNFAALAVIATATGVATTMAGTPAVLGPIADQLAAASGLPIETVLMSIVLGFSTMVFPYQMAPVILALQLGGVSMRDATRLGLPLALVTFLVLLPVNYLWWRLLGWLP